MLGCMHALLALASSDVLRRVKVFKSLYTRCNIRIRACASVEVYLQHSVCRLQKGIA